MSYMSTGNEIIIRSYVTGKQKDPCKLAGKRLFAGVSDENGVVKRPQIMR